MLLSLICIISTSLKGKVAVFSEGVFMEEWRSMTLPCLSLSLSSSSPLLSSSSPLLCGHCPRVRSNKNIKIYFTLADRLASTQLSFFFALNSWSNYDVLIFSIPNFWNIFVNFSINFTKLCITSQVKLSEKYLIIIINK